MITPSERYKRQLAQEYISTVTIHNYSSRHDLNAILQYKQQEMEEERGLITDKKNEFILSNFEDMRNNIYMNIKPNNKIELSGKYDILSELEKKLNIISDEKKN